MSESIFLMFSLISLLLVEKLVRGNSNRWLVPSLSVALTFVVFTRTIGIVLLVAVPLYLLFRKGSPAWREIIKIVLLMGALTSLIVAVTPVRLIDLLPFWYLQNDKNAQPFVSVVGGEADATTDSPDPNSTGGSQRFEKNPAAD